MLPTDVKMRPHRTVRAPRATPPLRGADFLYEHLAAELRRRVETGAYPAGTTIPSETELVREFAVSAITVRRAIRDLTFEGTLLGRQGRGVFVADRRRIVRVLGGDSATSIGDEIRRAGLVPAIVELAFAPLVDARAAARLGLARGAPLFRHEKLILADGDPVSVDVVDLPAALARALREELAEDFVFPLLRRHRIAVGRTDLEFEGATVSREHARLLGLPPGRPVILVRYTLFRPGGPAVLTGQTIARSDRFTFALSLGARPPAAPGARRRGAR
jgi:DNA-binding GntR family transcriptional regulator